MQHLQNICRVLRFALCSFGLITPAYPFGQQGHEAIAILALQKLHSDQAQTNQNAQAALKHIVSILGNDDLAAVAVWADWVRLDETNHLPEATIQDIDARFPGNHDWHFVDLPLGTSIYSTNAVSAGPDDVVQGIARCLTMLESPDTSPQKDHHAVALKFLVHLVGDLHQPLHVACGYYRWSNNVIVTDPAQVAAGNLPHDRGGNKLLLAAGHSAELHGLWDSDLVFLLAGAHSATDATNVAAALSAELKPGICGPESGEYHTWPANWATESIAAANLAYKDIQPSSCPDRTSGKPRSPRLP
jgi:hypothetical protein